MAIAPTYDGPTAADPTENEDPNRSIASKTRLSTRPKDEMVTVITATVKRMREHTGQWRKDAKEDFSFYAGKQWSEEDEAALKQALRPVITYNRVGPMIDAVGGLEINNRQETRYIPREMGDVGVNEVLTGAADWVRDEADAEDEETDAFIDALICGMGWTETRLAYDEDPDGMLEINRTDPLEMYWDTACRKRNLADAKHLARVKDYDEEDFTNTWPEWARDMAPAMGSEGGNWEEDNNEIHTADFLAYEDDEDAEENRARRHYRVTEYQWFELEAFTRTVNPANGEIEEVSPTAARRLRPKLADMGIPMVNQKRRKYYRAFVCRGQLLEVMELPTQKGFTYQCITGKRDRNTRTWYGMVRALKDPQRWANKFFSQILHALNSNAKGGVLAETDAFQDPDQAESDWAAPDNIVMMKTGALSGQNPKIMPKPAGAYPQGIDRLMEFSLQAFREVTGLNLEILGQADRMQPGVLEYQRKESAVTILAPIFDSLKRYRKMQGRILLEYIQQYLSDGRLVRILGEDGRQQYVPLVREEGTATYDVIVDDAPSSPNQREKTFQIMAQLLPVLLKAGMPIPPDVLDYAPLPAGLVAKWKEMLQPKDGQKAPSPEEIEAQGKAQKDQSAAQLNMAKAGTEQAKAQTEASKAQAVQAQAAAQMARIAEMTPVDQAQAQHFDAKRLLELQRAESERIRQETMKMETGADLALSREKEETERARQVALKRRPTGGQD